MKKLTLVGALMLISTGAIAQSGMLSQGNTDFSSASKRKPQILMHCVTRVDGYCWKCQSSLNRTGIPLRNTISSICAQMKPGSDVTTVVTGSSTVDSAPANTGTWVRWLHEFGSSGFNIDAASVNRVNRFSHELRDKVPANGLVIDKMTPILSQWGNAQGVGSPVSLLNPSFIEINAYRSR